MNKIIEQRELRKMGLFSLVNFVCSGCGQIHIRTLTGREIEQNWKEVN